MEMTDLILMWTSLMVQWIVFLAMHDILRSFSNPKVQKCFLHPSNFHFHTVPQGTHGLHKSDHCRYTSTWVFEYLLQGLGYSTKY